MNNSTLLDAIQKAVDAAAKTNVNVEVTIYERGFFPTERTEIKITAKKQSPGEAK